MLLETLHWKRHRTAQKDVQCKFKSPSLSSEQKRLIRFTDSVLCYFCHQSFIFLSKPSEPILLTRTCLSLRLSNLSEYILQKKLLSQKTTCIFLSEDFTLIDWSMHIFTDKLRQVSSWVQSSNVRLCSCCQNPASLTPYILESTFTDAWS